jgi:hypothetical protein
MAKQLKVLEFEVKSTDPDRRTIDAVREEVDFRCSSSIDRKEVPWRESEVQAR